MEANTREMEIDKYLQIQCIKKQQKESNKVQTKDKEKKHRVN